MTTRRTGRAASAGPGPSRGFLLVVSGAVLWGTGGLAGSALAREAGTSMLAVATVRLLTGGGLLLAGLVVVRCVRRPGRRGGPAAGRARLSARAWAQIGATGVLAAAYQACYFVAVGATAVSTATLVALGAAPVLAVAAGAIRRRRLLAVRVVVALAVALVGLGLLVGSPGTQSRNPALGLALALVAAAAFATTTLLNRTAVPGLDPLTLTGAAFLLGGLLLIPLAAVGAGVALPTGPRGWALVGYLGVGPTALAYGAYFTGLRWVPATTATVVALLEPVTATVGAAVLLHEVPTRAGLVGGVLLIAAIVSLGPAVDDAPASPTMDAARVARPVLRSRPEGAPERRE